MQFMHMVRGEMGGAEVQALKPNVDVEKLLKRYMELHEDLALPSSAPGATEEVRADTEESGGKEEDYERTRELVRKFGSSELYMRMNLARSYKGTRQLNTAERSVEEILRETTLDLARRVANTMLHSELKAYFVPLPGEMTPQGFEQQCSNLLSFSLRGTMHEVLRYARRAVGQHITLWFLMQKCAPEFAGAVASTLRRKAQLNQTRERTGNTQAGVRAWEQGAYLSLREALNEAVGGGVSWSEYAQTGAPWALQARADMLAGGGLAKGGGGGGGVFF